MQLLLTDSDRRWKKKHNDKLKKVKVGDIIKLNDNKRDYYFNKIGGLNVEILSIEDIEQGMKKCKVKLLITGNVTWVVF